LKKSRKRRPLSKARVAEWLQGRFFLRVHMSLILIGTFLAGLAATKLLLMVGVSSLALRYVLAVCAAYLVFLALIKLWLIYVRADRTGIDLDADGLDWIDPGVEGTDVDPGGGFGGGGATGSWGNAPAVKSSSSPSVDFSLDGDEWLVVILFLALVLSLLLVGVYIIYTAPALLAEAAFEALLAGTLVRRAKRIERTGWVGAVWRATVWPFLLIVVLSGFLGWAVRKQCPEATRLQDAWNCSDPRAVAAPPHS
jgi:hypothetical protein